MRRDKSASMDNNPDVMDFFSNPLPTSVPRHLGALTRLHPSRLPVISVGLIPRKSAWMNNVFTNYSFSFILRGQGSYHVDGRSFTVRAPCVLTQRHGEHFRYGPESSESTKTTWDELFVSYSEDCRDELQRLGFLDPAWPMWSIGNTAETVRHLIELVALLPQGERPGMVDRIDRTVENTILASLIDQQRNDADPRAHTIAAVAAGIESHPERHVDVDRLARQHGLAPSTFRRLWQQRHGESPHRYQDRVRMRRACRLLVESDAAIGVIAERLGFDDGLYFSRRFRQLQGMTASAYRRRYRTAMRRAEDTKGTDPMLFG